MRAQSLEGLIESPTASKGVEPTSPLGKSVSLENELDGISDTISQSETVVSDSDSSRKKNFMDKCVNKMKSLITKKPASHDT